MLNLKHRVHFDEKNLSTLFSVTLKIAEEKKSFFIGDGGHIFIIIDGLNLLVKENNGDEHISEDLCWLPE